MSGSVKSGSVKHPYSMSAPPSRADIRRRSEHFSFGPISDIGNSIAFVRGRNELIAFMSADKEVTNADGRRNTRRRH
jgi:hypothetical protein